MSSIENSPFYKDGASSLPYKEQTSHVKEGHLYMMDDAGGVVYQVFATDPSSNSVTGIIDVAGRVAVIHRNRDGLSAQSFEENASPTPGQPVLLPKGVVVTNLIKSGRATLDTSLCKLPVYIGPKADGKDEHFYVYDVHDPNGQLALVHDSSEQTSGATTETEVTGLLYIQYDGVVYIGSPSPMQINVWDPDGNFRPSDGDPVD